jgi:hypothetical protein
MRCWRRSRRRRKRPGRSQDGPGCGFNGGEASTSAFVASIHGWSLPYRSQPPGPKMSRRPDAMSARDRMNSAGIPMTAPATRRMPSNASPAPIRLASASKTMAPITSATRTPMATFESILQPRRDPSADGLLVWLTSSACACSPGSPLTGPVGSGSGAPRLDDSARPQDEHCQSSHRDAPNKFWAPHAPQTQVASA